MPAAAETVGRWTVEPSGQGALVAGTRNEGGNIIGYMCLENRNCAWLLTVDVECKEDSQRPVMANSDVGATPLTAHCMGPAGVGSFHNYMFLEFQNVDRMIKGATRIAFAMPLAKDEFQVVRFDLSGAKFAIDRLHERSQAQARSK
jgi:hypothetical protein